jgi:RHS repeat-associated protein
VAAHKRLASATYTYDQGTPATPSATTPQHIPVTGARGNLTSLSVSTSSTAALTESFTYYDTGMPKVVTDVNGTTTTYAYSTIAQGSTTQSCGNSFPTTTSVVGASVNLSSSTAWNCTGGVATQTTDANGRSVSSDYATDTHFWRPASVTDQLSNQTNISYSGQTAVETILLNFNSGSSASDYLTTIDGFGRTIYSQRKQSPTAQSYDTTETDYNNLGQPYKSTMSYSAGASPSSPNSSAYATTTAYDTLGRVVSITDPRNGIVSYTYTNNDVLQQVSGGSQTFKKQFEYDGLGRLSSVCEISSTLPGVGTCGQTTSQSGYWTRYKYDALGHLVGVCQNTTQVLSIDCVQTPSSGQQTRTFAYDWLGRMTSESNPETGNNGANGTVNYTYDSISPCADGAAYSYPGDLVQKKDNAGNYTCFAYDGLHRMTKAGNKSVANTTIRQFVYDSKSSYPTGVTVTNGGTHVIEATTINSSNLNTNVTDEFFSYSARGELTDVYESTPHSGGYYHTTTSYWPTGTLKTVSGIPGVPTLNYGANGSALDGEGRYTQVTAASGTNPITNVTYSTDFTSNPLGALTAVTFGATVSGNDSDNFTYDPQTGRPWTYTFSVNGKTDAGTLTWNTNGTLQTLAINDQIPTTVDSQTCTFTHDDLARIGGQDASGYSVDCPTKWQQLFTYDAFGNISKSGTSSFVPIYWGQTAGHYTNQFYSIPSASVSYDANGNLQTDNLNNYTWDPNWGNMLSVSNAGATVTATYDALGRVVDQQNGSTNTEILYSPLGKTALMNGTALTKAFLPLPGGATAVYTLTGLAYYRHTDWLGSSRMASTPARALYSSTAYAPFGEAYKTSGSADSSFTGQNSDAVSSLYDFTFREHSPSQGRWISPDPLGKGAVDPSSPQSWNRYAYTMNGPMSATDPFGLDCVYVNSDGSTYTETVDCNTTDNNAFYFDGTVNQDSIMVAENGDVFATLVGGDGNLTCSGSCTDAVTVFGGQGASVDVPFSVLPPSVLQQTPKGQAMIATISAVHKPTESEVEAACTVYAINANNGFGSVGGDSASASIWSGITFKQDTQYRRPNTMNPSAPNILILGFLASPSIYIQASYQKCKSAFGY